MSGPVDARRVADEIRLPQSMDRSERLRNEALDEHRQKLEPAELKSQGRRVLDSIAIEFEKLSPKQRENIKELRAQLCLPGDELQRALIKERIREMAPELARKFEELSKLVAQGRKVGEHRHDSDEKRAPRLHIDDGKRPEELIGVLSQLEGRRIAELRSDELLKKVLAPVLKSWREPILEDVVGRERAAVIRMEYARDHFSRAILSRLTGAETENFKAVLADFDRRATGLTAEQRKTTYDQLTRLVLEGNLPATEADRLKVAIQVLRNVDVSGEKAGTNLRIEIAKNTLEVIAAGKLTLAERADFERHMNQLQSRMGRTAPDEVIRTFAALSGMMTTRGGEKFQEPDRLIIAQQVMRQAAEPTCIDQGYNSTCNVTTIEVRAYARNPGAAAELIAEVTRNGSFRTAGGTTVHPFLPGLKHSESYEQQNPVPDGQRSWATKIFNAIAVNTYWAQQTKTPDGREVPRGSLKYEDYPEFRTNPETGLLEAHPDTGERLVDYSGKHPRML